MCLKYCKTFFLIVIIAGCVDPVIITNEEDTSKIVIDAMFTDNPDFNTVRISQSAGFSNDYPFVPFNAPVEGAIVRIFSNDKTSVFELAEIQPGLYKTAAAGIVGQSYYVEVVLPDNAVYRSQPEKIPKRVSIDGLTFTMDDEIVIDQSSGSRVELKRFYFNVYANVNDPSDEKNYYLWQTSGTFEYFTLPVGDAPCMYCYCWATFAPLIDHVSVFTDQYVDGGAFKHQIAHILYDRDTKFLARAHQFSIGERAYHFWNNIYKQQTTVGSIFDPMPQRIKGNVYREGDPGEVVLGFFTAAAVSSHQLLIKRGVEAARLGIKDPYLKQPTVGDCRPLYNNVTHIKPAEFYD
jgi:hypothetical protein